MSLFGVNDSKSNTGTVGVAANGLVTGVSTLLDTEARVGDYITVNTQDLLITSITSNTVMHVTAGLITDSIATAVANVFNLSEKPKSVTTSEVPSNSHGQPEKVFGVAADEMALGSRITAINVTDAGDNYTTPPTVGFTGGSGTGVTATAVMGLEDYTVTANGIGYTTPPTVGYTGGGGSGASATAVMQLEDDFTVTGAGTGYTNGDIIAITGGGGSGANCIVQTGAADNLVTVITLVTPGTGYTSLPTLDLSGIGGGDATATADALDLLSVTPVAGGTGWTTAPTVTFTGGGGTSAAATVDLELVSVTVTAEGSDYEEVPAVTFTGGAGTGAAAVAVALGESSGVAHTGWNRRVVGTGGRAGRVQYECLVAGGITGDAGDDATLPE